MPDGERLAYEIHGTEEGRLGQIMIVSRETATIAVLQKVYRVVGIDSIRADSLGLARGDCADDEAAAPQPSRLRTVWPIGEVARDDNTPIVFL